MPSSRSLRIVALSFITGLAFALAIPAAGAADPTITVVENLNASTHLKKLNQDVQIPGGTFTATIDLATGDLTGDIQLPPATVTLREAGLPVATATMAIQETQPVSGHVDFTTFAITATSTFNIKVQRDAPALLPGLNLVGNRCTTSTPVSVTMSGIANLSGPSTFTGTYTIPSLQTCGALTPVLSAVIAGPGNSVSATATPQ